MRPSGQLIDFLDRTPLPWINYDIEKEKIIIVIDNHLASMYRACPQHFVYSAIQGQQPKSQTREGEVQRIWFLDFGIILHKMLEIYYKEFRKPNFDLVTWATKTAIEEWREAKMDVHCEHKEYKLIGGVHGFVGLLIQFGTIFSPQNEKLRIIGQEISFGRRGEVPLFIGEFVEIYLAGRMDLAVDDGYFICPMDHKSMGYFKGDPSVQFLTDEGPEGYVFALHTILPTIISPDEILKRDCNKILMNLISKKPTDSPTERFKRVSIRYTTYQLIKYQERMISTAEDLLHDMERIANDFSIRRNTFACTDWKHGHCNYMDVCRQGSKDAVESTLKNGFIKMPIWNTETVNN
jgi:hypothetical protein